MRPVAYKLLTILSVNGIIEERGECRRRGENGRETAILFRLSGRSYFSGISRPGKVDRPITDRNDYFNLMIIIISPHTEERSRYGERGERR